MAPSADAIPWWDKAGKSGMGGVSARRAMSYLPPMSAENLLEPACAASPGKVHSAAIQVSTWGGLCPLGIRMGRSLGGHLHGLPRRLRMCMQRSVTMGCNLSAPREEVGQGQVGGPSLWHICQLASPSGQNKHPTAPPANVWLLPHTMSFLTPCLILPRAGPSRPFSSPSALRDMKACPPMFLAEPHPVLCAKEAVKVRAGCPGAGQRPGHRAGCRECALSIRECMRVGLRHMH